MRQSVEEELTVGVGRVMLGIPRREQTSGLEASTAVEVVDALAAIHSTNSALDLELRCSISSTSPTLIRTRGQQERFL